MAFEGTRPTLLRGRSISAAFAASDSPSKAMFSSPPYKIKILTHQMMNDLFETSAGGSAWSVRSDERRTAEDEARPPQERAKRVEKRSFIIW